MARFFRMAVETEGMAGTSWMLSRDTVAVADAEADGVTQGVLMVVRGFGGCMRTEVDGIGVETLVAYGMGAGKAESLTGMESVLGGVGSVTVLDMDHWDGTPLPEHMETAGGLAEAKWEASMIAVDLTGGGARGAPRI